MDLPREGSSRLVRRWPAWAAAGSGAALVGLLLTGFEPAAPEVDARTLLVAQAERGSFEMVVRGPGTLVPERIRWITALTAGRVEQRLLDPGATVEAETVILQLSNPDVQLEALDAERQLTAARGELLELRTGLEEQRLEQLSAVARARAAYQAARRDAEASEGLVAKKMVPAIEASEKRDRVEEMEAVYRAEQGRLALLDANRSEKIALQEEEVERLREIASFQRQRVGSMIVRAGTAGRLQETRLEVGQWVQPGETLAKVAEPRGLKAVLRIPETLARDVAIGQPGRIDTHNGIVDGRVFRIDPTVQDGSVEVHLRLAGELPRGARPDLSVDGTIETARVEDTLFVARPAFSQADSNLALFKLEPGGASAVRVNVRIGRVASDVAEIASGLEPGDRVIVSDTSRWDGFDRLDLN